MKALNQRKEEDITADFNEIDASGDDNVILRTLSDFRIFDEGGQLISIESISENPGRRVFVSGFVVEPLDAQWQQTILDNICSSPLTDSDNTDQPISRYAKQLDDELIAAIEDPSKFDRAALITGSNIDSYCTKTFKWYESKIVDVKSDAEGKQLVKVHFLGWKSRFDEWLDRNDERIAPRGHSQIVASKAEKLASRMVPWYEHHQIFATVSEIINSPIPKRKEVPILISGIEDWCIDLSYPNPNLWLIAESGIWYRLAGVFAPNGIRGNPAEEYAYIFQETYEKFYVTAQVAMSLLDILPVNPKISFNGMAQAITHRTGDDFSEILLLQHSSFIIDQLNSLEPPSDWTERKISIPNCHFMTQLLKEGTQFVAAGGILGLLANRSSSSRRKLMAQQYADAMNWVEEVEVAAPPPTVTSKSKGKKGGKIVTMDIDELEEWADQLAEEFVAPTKKASLHESTLDVEKPARKEKIKFPIDDDELWKMETRRSGLAKLPWPLPEAHQLRCPVDLCDILLSSWANIVNFRTVLRIPYLSFDTYETMLLSSNHKLGSLSKELFISMLSCILWEKGAMPKAIVANADKSAYAEEDDDISCINRLVMPDFVSSANPRSVEDERHHLICWLRLGDTWLEVLRLLIAERLKVVVPDVLDPLGECESILATLMKKPEAVPFLEPVDAVADDLPDYWSVVQSPMDLGTIKNRLESGWYNALAFQTADTMGLEPTRQESSDDSPESDTESMDECNEGTLTKAKLLFPISVGSLIDLFHTELHRWYPAEILSMFVSDEQQEQIICQLIEFGPGKEVTINRNCNRIRKSLTVSNDETKRLLSPEELDSQDKKEASRIDNEAPENDDLVAEGRPAVAKRPSTNEYSRYRGHDGFMEDMRLVFANSEKYFSVNDSNHLHLESSRQLSHVFEKQFEKRVRAPVNSAKQVAISSALLTSSASASASTSTFLLSPSKCLDIDNKSSNDISSNDISGINAGCKPVQSSALKSFDEVARNKKKKWEEDIELLGRTDFHSLDLSVKLRMLNWLSHEVLATAAAKAFMEKIISERKIVYARRQPKATADAAGALMNVDADIDAAGEVLADHSGEASIDPTVEIVTTNSGGGSLDPLVNSTVKKGRVSKGLGKSSGLKPSHSSSNINAADDGEGLANDEVDKPNGSLNPALTSSGNIAWGFNLLGVSPDDNLFTRLKPLGQDRHYRTYWTFPQDIETSRIFCRDILEFTDGRSSSGAKNSRWIVFRGDEDIGMLLNWLTEKGNRESQLKKAITAYLEARISEKGRFASALPMVLEVQSQPEADEGLELRAAMVLDSVEQPDEEQLLPLQEENGDGIGKRKRKSTSYFQSDMVLPVAKTNKAGLSSATSHGKTGTTRNQIPAAPSVTTRPLLEEDNSNSNIPDTRWLYLANYLSLQHTSQEFAIALVISVDLSTTGQLGLGVKESDSQVLVTSFKVSDTNPISAAKQAGVRIGDRILFANDKLIRSVSHIQAALKEMSPATADANESFKTEPSTIVSLHVLRRVNAFQSPGMSDAAAKEGNILQAMQLQGSEDERFLRLTRGEGSVGNASDNESFTGEKLYEYQRSFGSIKKIMSRTYIHEERYIPSMLLGVLYEMILNTSHPYMVTMDWIHTRSIYWLTSIRKWVSAIQSSSEGNAESSTQGRLSAVEELYSVMSSCLLQFEAVLFKRGTCLPASWNDRHQRRKWQIGCRDAKTYAQLSLTVTVLFQSINWRKYICACYPISKKTRLLSEDVSYARMGLEIPDENTTVLYYGEGHAESLQHQLAKKKKSPETRDVVDVIRTVSGASFVGDIRKHFSAAAVAADVGQNLWGGCNYFGPVDEPLFCKVSNVRLFLGGSPTETSGCQPFVQLDAVVSRSIVNLKLPAPQMVASTTVISRYHLSNVFLRIIDIIRQTPEAIPFMRPVSKIDFPDYYEKIKQPISLNEIREKAARRQSYFTISDLARDFELIKTNCLLFCEQDFPDVADAVVRLYTEFLALVNFFQLDIEAGLQKDHEALESMNSSCSEVNPDQPQIVSSKNKQEHYQACHGNWLHQVDHGTAMVSTLLYYIKDSQSQSQTTGQPLVEGSNISSAAQLKSIFDPRFTTPNPFRMYIDYSKYFGACLGATVMYDNVQPFVSVPVTTNPPLEGAAIPAVSVEPINTTTSQVTCFVPRAMVICAPVRPVDGANSFMVDRHRYTSVYKNEFSIPAKVRTISRTESKKGKQMQEQQPLAREDCQRYGVLVESLPSLTTCCDQSVVLPWRPFKVEWSTSEDERMANAVTTVELDENGIPRKSLVHTKRYEGFVNPWEIEYAENEK